MKGTSKYSPNLCLELKGGVLVMTFPYSADLVTLAQGVPGGKFNKKRKVWEYPASPSTYAQLKEMMGGLRCPEFEEALSTQSGVVSLRKYPFKVKPFDHQREAIEFILNKFGVTING